MAPADPAEPASSSAAPVFSLPALTWPALALLAGIAASHLLAPPAAPLVWLGCALLLLWLGLGWRRGSLGPAGLALALFVLGAGLLAQERGQVLPQDHISFFADNQLRQLEADLAAAPEPLPQGWRLWVAARSVDGQPASGLLQLGLPAKSVPPQVGTRLAARVKIKPITSFANPGGFDYARHMAMKGIHAQAYAGAQSSLSHAGPGELDGFSLTVERLRQRIGALFDRLEPGPARGLLRALVLGQLGELSPQAREAFAATGTAHLLAISGMNLAMVWAWAFMVLRYALAAWPGLGLRLPLPKLAACLALMPTAVYALVGGASIPTLRALVMACCLVAALLVNRPYQGASGLALAVLVIGLIWPEAPLTLSFHLSFLAVAAIIWAAGPLGARLRGRGWRGKLAGALLGVLLMTAVIEALLLPLTAHHFHQIPWLSLPANLILVPLIGSLAQLFALLGVGLGLLWPDGGTAILQLAWWPAWWGVQLNLYLAALPWAVSFVAGPGLLTLGLFYAALAAALLVRPGWRWGLAAGLLAAALASGVNEARPAPPDGRLTLWVLDVGQGSAAVARLPQGQALVVDGGGGYGELDFGQRVLGPFLWSQGIKSLEALAASHPHPDHVDGLPFLARWFDPRQIWVNGDPPQGGSYARLWDAAAVRGIPVLGPGQLERRLELGGAELRLLWPPPGQPPGTKADANHRSLWIGLGLGRTWVWLPGDNGAKVERAILPSLPRDGRQVLVAPHHGGKGSCTAELLAAMNPQAVVISAGCANRFGMPRADTMERVRRAGAKAYLTARQGAIKLSSDGQEWSMTPWLQPARECPLPEGVNLEDE